MYKNAVGYSEENELHKFILLDGDKKKPKENPDNFTVTENAQFNFLKKKLIETTGIDYYCGCCGKPHYVGKDIEHDKECIWY